MTDTNCPLERQDARPGERGSALVAVLLLLMMMTALAAALSVGSQTETYISRNENSGAMAQAAAEAGLNHAVELVSTYIFEYKSNGFGEPEEAVNSLLRGPDGASGNPDDDLDNTSLAGRAGIDAAEDIPLEATPADRLSIAGASGVSYTAWILDDDDTAPAGNPDFAEDGDPTNDVNRRLLIRATGYGPDGSKVTLEATLGPANLPAIVTEGDLTLDGSVEIIGPADPDAGGAIHTNSDLTIDGNGGTVTGAVTASGAVDNSNDDIVATGGAAQVEIPPVAAADYEVWADFKLLSDGTMLTVSDGSVCTWSAKTSCNNWDFDSGTGVWSNNGTPTDGTYYVQGGVNISGSPGTTETPVRMSLIAEGSIDISGSPKLQPSISSPDLLFVTDQDLKIVGNLDEVFDPADVLEVQGQMLVHEQVEIGGSVTLAGQLRVEDADDVSNLVTANSIHGNVSITYGGGIGGDIYSVMGWRDVRDAD